MTPAIDPDYRAWVVQLKTRFRQVQLKAAVTVNTTLLRFYWELGADMLAKQSQWAWGSGFLGKLSIDLMQEFPQVKGFSKRNLELVRQWYRYWTTSPEIAQQAVSQLFAILWGHNLAVIAKCQSPAEALYYRAVDAQLRGPGDAPSIGLLLCKSKDRLVAEYALSDIQKPLGLSTYALSNTLPDALRDQLPSIEVIEAELAGDLASKDL